MHDLLPFPEAFLYVAVVFTLAMATGYWQVFVKAERNGWECLIPGYNLVALTRIVGRPWWWALGLVPGPVLCWEALTHDTPWLWLPAVPCLLLLAWVHWKVSLDLAKSFNRSRRFARRLALLPFVYVAMLGAGHSEYAGPAAQKRGAAACQ